VTLVVTMEYSGEDSDYSEASNEVNDENKNSPSHNAVDVSADTYESTNGGKSMTKPLMSLVSSILNHIPIYQSVPLSSNLLLPFFSSVYTESDQEYLKEIAKEGRKKFLPSTTDYYESRDSLHEKVSDWSHSKGFTASTEDSSLRCQKHEEPPHYSKQGERRSLFQNTSGEKLIPPDATAHLSSNSFLPLLALFLELLQKLFASVLDHNTYIVGGAFPPKANFSP
jgi:hypothetical protein